MKTTSKSSVPSKFNPLNKELGDEKNLNINRRNPLAKLVTFSISFEITGYDLSVVNQALLELSTKNPSKEEIISNLVNAFRNGMQVK